MLTAVCRRALEGYGGVDEVVQDTAVAALLGVAGLRDPERFVLQEASGERRLPIWGMGAAGFETATSRV
jgi:hypothetical protein